jgi:hypothetical protein
LEVEKRILSVLDKQETYGGIVRSVYPDLMKNIQEKTVISDASLLNEDLKKSITIPSESLDRSVIVDNDKSLHCIFCPECIPQP